MKTTDESLNQTQSSPIAGPEAFDDGTEIGAAKFSSWFVTRLC